MPHCQQEKHNKIIEEETKSQSYELRKQSLLSIKLLEEQHRIASEQRATNKELLKIQNKALRAQEIEISNQKRFRCIGFINELLPAIKEKNGINFLISHYLRIGSAIEIWSEGLVTREILRDALAEDLNQAATKIIKSSDELAAMVMEKREKIKTELQNRANSIIDDENINIENRNGQKALVICGLAISTLIWLYFTVGFGLFFIILSTITIAASIFLYNLIYSYTNFYMSVSDEEVSAVYNEFLDDIPWYVDEHLEANKMAKGMNNGMLSIIPILNKWDSSSDDRTSLLSDIKLQISIAKKFKAF